MKKIGITGCIGSGKTTVSRIFMQLGVPVYDADSRAKWLMQQQSEVISGIKKLFGKEAYSASGELNRAVIAQKVFSSPALLQQLNAVVHPAVFKDFDDWSDAQSQANHKYIIKEAALMFESDSYKHLDEVITVTAPSALRISRAMQRDNATREAVISRMKNQMSEDEKRKRSQYEIKNDEENLLIPQVLKLHRLFSQY